ncbi:MAG: Peptidase M20D, amidohydrolase [uncultured Corynebacteriales bacterium]|uniref:Peptidase M20D, amidohydrolase n=1 Tax=uncultured Mycobacteriales bacterium TaxID=581187 RepID=A0A6J4IIW7_9ACTN|nr:MAG: Peptidase M20D, amidohydrolase [uncultured Corynebacteriales bacterium]
MDPARDLLAAAVDIQPDTVALRRRLHRRPEVGLTLPETQATVLDAIAGLPLRVTTGTAVSSVTGVLDGGRPGPTVLLRGDMDALPMPEDTGLDFASEIPGVMHACGHDTHVAMLVGAARLLSARQAELPGKVVFMWQPGEEGFGGAKYMLEEGVLEAAGTPVDSAYALHITTNFGSGVVTTRRGPAMASSDVIRIVVTGRGGHASHPSAALDPVPVAAAIVLAIQTMVTREISVFDPAVVTIAKITAGTTDNVIPETAELLGTMRTLSEQNRRAVKEKLRRLAPAIAAAHGASAEVFIDDAGYPVTVNADAAADLVHATTVGLLGPDRAVLERDPIMGAEDWSYVLQRVPGAMSFLGACPPGLDPDAAPPNHSNRVVFDEDAMAVGVATHVAVALAALEGTPPPA